MKKEVWKPIKNYEGHYEVSSMGRVRVLERIVNHRYGTATRKPKIMALAPGKDGYLRVSLHRDGILNIAKVHRLVAITFLPPDEFRPHVNHKNGIKHNNWAENLEWVTRSENARHLFDVLGFKGSRHGERNVNGKSVHQFSLCGIYLKTFVSATQASRILGISNVAIGNCLRGKSKSCAGYKWSFKLDN